VGVMLISYGTFWVGEGLGIHWPGSDGFLALLVALYGVGTFLVVLVTRRAAALVVAP